MPDGLRAVETVLESEAVLVRTRKPIDAFRADLGEGLVSRIEGVLATKESKYIMLNAPESALGLYIIAATAVSMVAHFAFRLPSNRGHNVLVMQIETNLRDRSGAAVTNFEQALPVPHSDLARESLKDPYRFDFLGLGAEAGEREIETALIDHVTDFLMELGAGFAYVGRQVLLNVGGDDFFIDLLFYHLKLHCYVVIELKATEFKPEHVGQLGFYMAAQGSLISYVVLCFWNAYAQNKIDREFGVAED